MLNTLAPTLGSKSAAMSRARKLRGKPVTYRGMAAMITSTFEKGRSRTWMDICNKTFSDSRFIDNNKQQGITEKKNWSRVPLNYNLQLQYRTTKS